MSFDLNRLSSLDRAVVSGAAIAFVSAFLPWYGVTVGPFSVSASGWSAGFTAWAGALLLTAAGVLVVLRRSGTSLTMGDIGPAAVVAGVAGLGLLLVVIRWISFPRYHGIDVGARFGIYLALIAGLVEVTAAVMEVRGGSTEGEPAAQAPADEPPEPAAPAEPAEPAAPVQSEVTTPDTPPVAEE